MNIKKISIKIIGALLIIITMSFLYGMIHLKAQVVATDTYFVSSGDTLWSIAIQNSPKNMNVWDYIDLLCKYNKDLTTDIYVGQEICLPIVEE